MNLISLFAGIGGFDLGFERAGIETVAVVEKDESCRKLLSQKFPRAQIFDDVCTVGRHNLPDADVVVFGFPCQDLSIAGDREGLGGSRSGLYFQATRIVYELQPAFLLWENVPGLLSSDERDGFNGRDFCRVLMELGRIGYNGAWRVLDAQYLGVAQRRRRVFGCFSRLDLGAQRCAEILSLAEGMRGHPAPRREKRKGVTGTLAARSRAGGGLGTDLDLDGGLQVTGTLDASKGVADENDAAENRLVPEIARTLLSEGADASPDGSAHTLIPEIGKALTTSNTRIDAETETLLVDEVADPISASEGKTYTHEGKNNFRMHNVVAFDTTQITHPENRSNPQPGDPSPTLAKGAHAPAIAFSAKDSGADAGDISPTLRAGGHDKSHSNGGVMSAVTQRNGVRRLTPTECERLQGFPDGWTVGFADSIRYKMLGNAVAVPVAEWIGRRLKNNYLSR